MPTTEAPAKDTHVPIPISAEKKPIAPAQGGPILRAYTALHVAISLVAIITGLAVLGGMLAAYAMPTWTAVFLWTTIATSVTGFFFPYTGFKPSYAVGIVSLVLLTVAWLGLYHYQLAGSWRWIYVVTAVASLYLNVFVLVVQMFRKIPSLHALAPTESEAPFRQTHLMVFTAFVILGAIAVRNFR